MSQGWYVSQNGNTTGPLTTEQVLEGVKQNKFTADATVCAAGLTRFRKITDEPELAKAFAAPTTLPQAACATGTRCCPMPRIVAATAVLLTGGFWSTAAVLASQPAGTTPARLPGGLGIALAAVAGVVALFTLVGIVRRKAGAHCMATALHVAGIVGAVSLARAVCPGMLIVGGVHLLGLIAAQGARRQICKAKQAPTTV